MKSLQQLKEICIAKIKMYRKQICLLGLIAIACLCCIFFIVSMQQKTFEIIAASSPSHASQASSAPEDIVSDEPDYATLLAQAQAETSDAVAWLRIPHTDINNVVMQYEDNDYYLRRNEQRQPDVWGCYFADYFAQMQSAEVLTQNTVIYGHTQKNENPEDKRFSQLFHYTDIEFLKENPNIYLTIGNQELVFQIFAVFYSDINFYYIDPNPSAQGFHFFMGEVQKRNEYVFEDITVTEQDKLLTLSGCSYRYDTYNTGNHRFVVMGKLVEQAENCGAVTVNPTPQRPMP